MIEDWLDFAFMTVGGATAFVCLFEGSRRIATRGLHRNGVMIAALAAVFYLVYGGLASMRYFDLKTRLDSVQQSLTAPQPQALAAKSLSPEKKEASSLARARLAFEEAGTLGSYFDRSGRRQPFVPTPEDIRRRERVVVSLVQMDAAARGSLVEALTWMVTGLLAVAFGYAFSREKGSDR